MPARPTPQCCPPQRHGPTVDRARHRCRMPAGGCRPAPGRRLLSFSRRPQGREIHVSDLSSHPASWPGTDRAQVDPALLKDPSGPPFSPTRRPIVSKSVTKAWNRAERARRNRMIPTSIRLRQRYRGSFVTDLDTGPLA